RTSVLPGLSIAAHRMCFVLTIRVTTLPLVFRSHTIAVLEGRFFTVTRYLPSGETAKFIPPSGNEKDSISLLVARSHRLTMLPGISWSRLVEKVVKFFASALNCNWEMIVSTDFSAVNVDCSFPVLVSHTETTESNRI